MWKLNILSVNKHRVWIDFHKHSLHCFLLRFSTQIKPHWYITSTASITLWETMWTQPSICRTFCINKRLPFQKSLSNNKQLGMKVSILGIVKLVKHVSDCWRGHVLTSFPGFSILCISGYLKVYTTYIAHAYNISSKLIFAMASVRPKE
jgi:hypothetical protein